MKKAIAVSIIMLCILGVSIVSGAEQANQTTEGAQAKEGTATRSQDIRAFGLALSVALTMGVTAFSAGYAIAHAGAAAVGAMAEKPEVSTWGIIIVALAEGIALYGLVISFMLIGKL